MATLSRVRKGSGFKRSARGRVLASSVVEVRAVSPSPWDAELADLKLQRFRFLPAFADCIGDLIVREMAYVASTRMMRG